MADERIEAAIAHWAPRFTTQGVDMNDFQRATDGLETWDEWLPAWRANGDLHTELAVEAEGHGRLRSAGEAFVRAALSYHFAKFVWMVDMAEHDHAEQRAIHSLANAHRLLDPTAERIEIPLDGMTMAANLRRPRIRSAGAREASSGRRSCCCCPGSTRPRRSSSTGSRSSSTAASRRCRSTARARARSRRARTSTRTTRSR